MARRCESVGRGARGNIRVRIDVVASGPVAKEFVDGDGGLLDSKRWGANWDGEV